MSPLKSALFGALLGLLSACAGTSAPHQTGRTNGEARLFVVRRGWHIDVGFEAATLSAPLDGLATQFPDARYLLFGFGDRRYLEARRRGVPEMAAALWPGDGLLLVTALNERPSEAFAGDSVRELHVSLAQVQAAEQRIVATLSLSGGALQSEGPGPYAGSSYLRAAERYSALHTCNTWAAQVLQAGGLPVSDRGVVFAGQLWSQLLDRSVR